MRPLVLLARAVNVEIAETRHLRGEPVGNAARITWSNRNLEIAIHIERLFQFALFTEISPLPYTAALDA